jgi:hypothetical protein
VATRRFAAAYGRADRTVAAVTVNMPRVLEAYAALIEEGAPFLPDLHAADGPDRLTPVSAGFPAPGEPTHSPGATPTGPGQSTRPPRRPRPRCAPRTRGPRPAPHRCPDPRQETDHERDAYGAGYGDVFGRVLDPAHRSDPYPLYARLRGRPVAVQDDGAYVVSTYATITRLLHDPRISSDERKSARGAGALAASGRLAPPGEPGNPPFIFLDPPERDRLRLLVMQQFTPARIRGMHRRIGELVDGLLDAGADGASSTSWTTWPTRCRSR